jgi:hypothetical protein
MIHWECTFCEERLTADEDDAGERTECSRCKAIQCVPESKSSTNRLPTSQSKRGRGTSEWLICLMCIFGAMIYCLQNLARNDALGIVFVVRLQILACISITGFVVATCIEKIRNERR